jgi:HK97 family phage prohead protease
MTTKRDKLVGAPERRTLATSDFEIRADGDTMKLTGYASVFESGYEVFGGPPSGWTEIVDRKAFDKTLREKPDVHLLINHEGMPLARTKSGTLGLSIDSKGLKVAAELDRTDPDVQRLDAKMRRGDMDQMSFAFRTIRQEWNEDESERRLLEVSIDRGDVSVVNFGANPKTSSQLRSLVSQLAAADVDAALAEMRSTGLDEIRNAHKTLGDIVRALTPAEKRTMSLAEAMAVIDG